jgi:carboxypeptidase Q
MRAHRLSSLLFVVLPLACAHEEPPLRVASAAPRCDAELHAVGPSGALAPSAAPVAAPAAPTLSPIAARVLDSSQAYAITGSLADEVGARLTGSPAAKLAVAWGLRTMKSLGLANVREEAVRAPHWVRGEEEASIVAPSLHPVVLKALGGSVGTGPKGLEAEVVEVSSIEALQKLDRKLVEGKIVFFYRVMRRSQDGSGYGEAVGVRSRGAIAAAKLGAVGVVIRSIGTDSDRVAHTGGMRYEDGVPKIPAAAFSIPDADLLHRLGASGAPVRVRLRLGAKLLGEVDAANVVGEVVGSEAPDEIVLLGAHLDSWDVGQGAVDDAAGCGVMLEVARQLATGPQKPRRTVRVVLFANEENGLAGAKAYAVAHEAELAKHVVAIEADLGAGRVLETRFLGGDKGRAEWARFALDLAALGVARSDADADGGADLIPLRGAGVPVLDLRQDASRYFDLHHTDNDTFDKIDKAELDAATAAFAVMVHGVAMSREDFGRIPEAKRGASH